MARVNGHEATVGPPPSALDLAEAFLFEKHSILWGRAWDINALHSRRAAAEWLVDLFAEFEEFLDSGKH